MPKSLKSCFLRSLAPAQASLNLQNPVALPVALGSADSRRCDKRRLFLKGGSLCPEEMVRVLLVKDREQVAGWGEVWGEEEWEATVLGQGPAEIVFVLAVELSLLTRCLCLATT